MLNDVREYMHRMQQKHKSTPEEIVEELEGRNGIGCCLAAAPEGSAEVEKLYVRHWLHKGCSSSAPASTGSSNLKSSDNCVFLHINLLLFVLCFSL